MIGEINRIKEQNEKRCILCNKPYNYKYQMFGRGCVDNLYTLLKIAKPPRIISNKELYLCTRIAWRNHKFFLNKNKKYALAQDYIALSYLNRMDLEFLEDTKEKISSDIKGISTFSKNDVKNVPFKLNDVYQSFNYYQKFNELMDELKNINFEKIDEKIAKDYIQSLSFIFDVTKKSSPISYVTFYSMQYIFWQVVVAGGILNDKKLSAILLNHSLSLLGKNPENLIIDNDQIINDIIGDKTFRQIIKKIIEEHSEENKINIDNFQAKFKSGDLLFALHKATMKMNAIKNESNIWNIEIEITDTYDFTEFKCLREYADEEDDKFTDIIATTLNNFAVASSDYGVIKFYEVKINLKFDSTRLYN